MRKLSPYWLLCIVVGVATLCLAIYYPLSNPPRCYFPDTITRQLCRGKITERFSEVAWGKFGETAYRSAAQWMLTSNGEGQPMDEQRKRYLRPHFGGLVDRVQVIYNAVLIDEFVGANLKIDVGHSHAQVFGDKIYISAPYKVEDFNQMVLLSHEMVHVRQFHTLGSLEQFGYQYFIEYFRAGQSYKDNKMEVEAFEFEEKFTRWVRREIAKQLRFRF